MAAFKPASRIARLDHRGRASGFTLLELIVVITIMGILVSIALPNYRNSILQAKESVLRENLYRLRDLIDQYQSDKGRYPESLEALVTDGYVRKIPPDPMTPEPWVEVPPESDPTSGDAPLGVYDVKSASAQVGMNGTPYSEW
ncbi:MAG: type II secretion system protein [Vicinamibacteria bacterium]